MNEAIEIINSIGFPVFCVLCCGFYIYKTNSQYREDTKAREEKTYEQLEKFAESMDAFNDTLKSIDNRLAVVEQKIEN